MTITRIIGDVHGLKYDLESLVHELNPETMSVLQLGDLGVGFGQSDYWHESLDKLFTDLNGGWIRGNHDNPAVCETMNSWIADGDIRDHVMFIGGAWSIDNPIAPPGWHRRTAGVDWWFDEECSDPQFEKMLESYAHHRPKVLITHDCPASVSYDMFWRSGFLTGPRYPTRTGAWLDKFFEIHRPKYHFFGHWHNTICYSNLDTVHVCLDELDFMDVDLADLDHIDYAINKKFGD
jgi:hypothetical protein